MMPARENIFMEAKVKIIEVGIPRTHNGVQISVIAAEEIEGEYEKRSFFYIFYIGILWLVSIWAMISNFARAILSKISRKRKGSLPRILWEMGRDKEHISSFFVDRFSRFNHQAKWGAAGWRSLELFYNYHKRIKPQLNGNLEGFLTRYWIEKMENRQAVTNRLKLVIRLLSEAFLKFINEPEIRIISLASGSAQAVIEAMQKNPNLNIKALLIDVDSTAIEESKRLVELAGLKERFSFINNSAAILESICADFKPHIIEMVGFLDYRPDKKAVKLISRINNVLVEGGIFLTCNIRKNHEKVFLNWVLLWPMIYRDEKQLANLLVGGGFSPDNIQIIYEPFRIHGIGVCRK